MNTPDPPSNASPGPGPGRWMDQLTIQTPEQTMLEFPLAGIGSRYLAVALDTLIEMAIFLFLGGLFLLFGWMGLIAWRGIGVWTAAIFVLASFLVYFGYFAFFEVIWDGQTPGKRWMGLRVIQDSGRPLNVFQAIARNLLRIVDQIPGFYCFGIVSALLNRQNKRLGDFVAGTVVVHEKRFEEVQPDWTTPQKSAAPAAWYNTASLTDTEYQLIETFLARRAALDPDLRSRLARELGDRVVRKLEIAPQARPTDEALLESVLQQARAAGGARR